MSVMDSFEKLEEAVRGIEANDRYRQIRLQKALFTIQELQDCLLHAERRLNEIPHRYKDTDFARIRNVLQLSREFLAEEKRRHE